MGILWDLVAGLIAVIGMVLGRIVGVVLVSDIGYALYLTILLALIGLVLAGVGLKRKSMVGAFVTGIGLGLATPVVGEVSSLLHIHL